METTPKDTRLAALEAVANALSAYRDAGSGRPSLWDDVISAHDALDALLPPPPAGATERVRVAVYRERDGGWRSLVLFDGEAPKLAARTYRAILTADIPTEPPPVPEVAATVEQAP